MADLGNKISITLSAFDMVNMLATVECIFIMNGFPTPDVKESFYNFKDQVFNNCSDEAIHEALAEMNILNLMNEIKNNSKN